MPVETRRSNKDAHPGLPDLEPKAKRRTSEQVEAERQAKAAQDAEQALVKEQVTNRMAELQKEMARLQAEQARIANLSLQPSTVEEPPKPKKKKGKPGKGKSVSGKKKNAPLVTEAAMDVDTEIEGEPPKAPTQRKNAKGTTRADIDNAKTVETAAKAGEAQVNVESGSKGKRKSGSVDKDK